MVKLAQTIGAVGIAQSVRMPMNMGSHVIEVRQSLYDDKQQKDATRVFPWTDIQYAGAEVAGSNSVIASCYVPIVAGVALSGEQGLTRPKVLGLAASVAYATGSEVNDEATRRARDVDRGADAVMKDKFNDLKYMQTGFGMSDYIFGISQSRSSNTAKKSRTAFNKARNELYGKFKTGQSVDGTAPLEVKQFLSEDEALDEITAFPERMIFGFVMGPRDVKLYYTETAVGMMVRRLRRVVEALGPLKPTYYPIGLGHLEHAGKPWIPSGIRDSSGRTSKGTTPTVRPPAMEWNCGAVQYKAKALKATGTYYIPWDQTPYSTMRRNFKYNHIMTQVGLELMECMTALGIGMNKDLKEERIAAFKANGTGTQVCALQMLFAGMFGTTVSHNATSDFTVDEASVAAGLKDRLGMLFNSGHIHMDPGVLTYERIDGDSFLTSSGQNKGKLTTKVDDLTYKGHPVSAATLYKEFIAKYMTFCVCAQALESYFAVPLYECHWLYVGSPKPEYVTEQLQMNFRSDVYFDGDNSLPFTLIPSRLNPGEVISRIPCYFDTKSAEKSTAKNPLQNVYLGVRDPLPFGTVQEIRYAGDRPLTTIEERDYTFAPLIEADASVQTQYRNSRTVNVAVWPRPSVYSPGATKMGAIYGMLSDNAGVGGHYYYQPLTGTMLNDKVSMDVVYRAMTNDRRDSKVFADQIFKGQTRDNVKVQGEYWDKHSISEKNNPQMVSGTRKQADTVVVEPEVFPTTVSGRKPDGRD